MRKQDNMPKPSTGGIGESGRFFITVTAEFNQFWLHPYRGMGQTPDKRSTGQAPQVRLDGTISGRLLINIWIRTTRYAGR
jgi:hypothetical protein